MSDFLAYLYNPTTITLVLGGILTSLFGFLAGISKTKRTPRCIAWFSFVAGLMVLFGGIYSGYQDQMAEELILAKTNQIAEISQKNAELALKNSELSQKIANLITGGGSYCYVLFTVDSKTNRLDFFLIKEGEYPVYGVKVKIDDIKKRVENIRKARQEGIPMNTMSDFARVLNRSARIIEIGDIGPNLGYPLGTFPLPKDANKARYEIEITAKNGRVLQDCEFRRVKGRWIRAEKIYFNNKLVKRYIDPNFPKDEASKSFWEE